ncbi:esterase/lipase family protein [Antrihabitans cavernicola]|uniref:Lipase n=1 Tax=Antrihabitans cavernicola TaxID=2495913 RepID=A0A5A7SIT5_9NOCA|nr:hypothetical protein [Spelaeibacter cavernicola]KAA0024637.1 hypothetical protein FOY51_01430 [Spelaeibacter cavernicola]
MKFARFVVTGMLAGLLVLAAAPAGAAPVAPAGTTIEPPIGCLPTAARPDPVVVLPGADGTTAQTAEQWAVMTQHLRGAGACVLVFQGGIIDGKRWAGDIPAAAVQVAQFVDRVEATTGARKVDIVAHSAGSIVANYYLKVLHGAPNVEHAVFIASEGGGCDGAGSLAALGIKNLPITPVQVLRTLPFMAPILAQLLPDLATTLQMAPGSAVYESVFVDGPVTQPGVRYAVLASKADTLATPAGTCSFITEPGVTNVFYEDLFPGRPPVDHSTIRSSPDTANWVVDQLYS